jgi:hypothetical protein
MPFDPAKPADHSPLSAGEMRAQLTALKSLVDALCAQTPPLGSIVAWAADLPGVGALPPAWARCDGQVLDDPLSPLHGRTLPDLNGGNRFLRGAMASGDMGGAASHAHGYNSSVTVTLGTDYAVVDNSSSTTEETSVPPYYEVVWVMRVR